MDVATQLGFNFAKEVATQLITLSTGLLTLTITFTKEIVRGAPRRGKVLLPVAWGTHFVSIVFGVFALMALTGTLMPLDPSTRNLQFGPNVRMIAGVQIVTFLLGTGFLALYGWKSFRAVQSEVVELESVTVTLEQLAALLTNRLNSDWQLVHIVPTAAGVGQLLVVFRRTLAVGR